MKKRIETILFSWQTNCTKSFYLAFLRVFMSVWMLKEIAINIPYLKIIYSIESFVKVTSTTSIFLFPVNIHFFREHYLLFIILYCVLLLLNIFGIGKNYTSFIVFVCTEIFFRMNMNAVNGGIEMARFIFLYLSFANTFYYFSFTKKVITKQPSIANLVTNLMAYAIILHLCIVYFTSALYKMQTPQWLNGTALYYAFNYERYSGTIFNKVLGNNSLVVYFITYFTLAFELLFPLLILHKKLKKIATVIGITMHLCIYFLFMIYGFQVLFIALYGLLFSNKNWQFVLSKLKINFAINIDH